MSNAEARITKAVELMEADERGARHVGKSLIEYVNESGHQGWELSARDLQVIANFLEDLERYVRYSG